jgi:hypothetical protein
MTIDVHIQVIATHSHRQIRILAFRRAAFALHTHPPIRSLRWIAAHLCRVNYLKDQARLSASGSSRLVAERAVAEHVNFLTDLVGLGMAVAADRVRSRAELVEDVQGLLPGSARGFPVAGGMTGVSEAVEYGCLQMAVAEFVVEVKSLLIEGGGVLVAADVMMGVAEAVERVGQAAAISQFLLQGKRLLAQGQGPVVVSEPAVVPADVIERVGLPGPVVVGEVQAEGLLGILECVGRMILIVEHPADDQVGFRLTELIAELREQSQGLLEVGAGFGMAAEP